MLFENFEKLSFQGSSNSIRVSDNHSANELAYKLLLILLKEFSHLDNNLFIEHDCQKIYLLHNAVYLTNLTVRNNLLNYKPFIFPAFEYDGLEDPISFKGCQISSKLFHDIFEEDCLLEANLRKLHPGNCKQNVPVALTNFHESTSAALTSYFPEKKNEAEFLKVFNTRWIICNSKVQF